MLGRDPLRLSKVLIIWYKKDGACIEKGWQVRKVTQIVKFGTEHPNIISIKFCWTGILYAEKEKK